MFWLLATAGAAEPVTLTLAEALDRLHTDSTDLAQARARVDGARGIARQARAGFLPIVVGSGSYTLNDSEVVLGFSDLLSQLPIPLPELPDDVVIQPGDVFNVAGTVRLPLVAASAWAEWGAARQGAVAAEATVAELDLQLQMVLVQAAASAEAAEGLLTAAERAAEVAGDHLRATQVAQAAGTATSVDVLGAEADVARRRSEVVAARAAMEGAQDGLGSLLSVKGPVRVALPEGAAPEGASGHRPALDAAAAQIRSAEARVDAAHLRHLPTLTATGTALAATTPFPTGNDTAYKIGVEATWTLYDGGLRYGRLDQARADVAGAAALQEAESERVSREVRAAERDLRVATEQLALATERSRLGTEASRVAQRGLVAGAISPLQARQVDADAFLAEVGVVAARAQVRVAQAALRRASGLGQGW